MQARGPPRNVNICPHTPGIDEAASGVISHLSGLNTCPISKGTYLLYWTNALEFQRIFSPYRFCSVKNKNGYKQSLAFLNPTKRAIHKKHFPKKSYTHGIPFID